MNSSYASKAALKTWPIYFRAFFRQCIYKTFSVEKIKCKDMKMYNVSKKFPRERTKGEKGSFFIWPYESYDMIVGCFPYSAFTAA